MKKSLFQSGVILHGGRCRTQSAAFLRSFSVVLFLLPLLFAHTAYGDINAELIKAAWAGNTAKVEQLLRKGADVDAETEDGQTALIIAVAFRHTEIMEILIDAGADVNATHKNGATALMEAAAFGHTEIMEILIDAGADVNAESKYGETALIPAADGGHTETVKALMEAGADVNAESKYGETALHYAARAGHTETVKALIEAGADVNAKDNWGRTALWYAAQESHTETVNILKQAGAQAGASYAELIGIFFLIVAVIIFLYARNFARAALMKIIEGRANREQYFLVIALNIVVAIIISVAQIPGVPIPEIIYILLFLIFIIGQYFLITFGIKRLHDFDQSGWWCLIALVPIANVALLIALLFAPSTDGENRFGQPSDTRKYRVMKVVGSGVIGLFVGAVTGLVIFAVGASGGGGFGYALILSPLAGMPFGITGAVIGLIAGLVIGIRKPKAVNSSTNPLE